MREYISNLDTGALIIKKCVAMQKGMQRGKKSIEPVIAECYGVKSFGMQTKINFAWLHFKSQPFEIKVTSNFKLN